VKATPRERLRQGPVGHLTVIPTLMASLLPCLGLYPAHGVLLLSSTITSAQAFCWGQTGEQALIQNLSHPQNTGAFWKLATGCRPAAWLSVGAGRVQAGLHPAGLHLGGLRPPGRVLEVQCTAMAMFSKKVLIKSNMN